MTDRDRKRQEAWIKAEARRQVAQEQADALTALGVPCAVRSGWVALLDPVGLGARVGELTARLDAIAQTAEQIAYNCECQVGGVDALSVDTDWLLSESRWRPDVWPPSPATEATLPAVTTPATEPHSGKGGGSDAHREERRRARAAFAELRRIDPPCSCPEQTYLDRVATYTAPAGVEPHAAACPRNGQLEGDRLDWLATDYPATQWPSEGGQR